MTNKKGLSEIVSYVLIVGISIGLSILVYSWMKGYVPNETLECPDGVSISINRITYEESTKILNITLRNNGRFSIIGFYIRGSNKSSELKDLSDLDLSEDMIIMPGQEYTVYEPLITFTSITENSFLPTDVTTRSFNLSKYGVMKKIEIVPARSDDSSKKRRILQCSNAKIQEILTFNA